MWKIKEARKRLPFKGYKMNRYQQLSYFIAKTVYAEYLARSADELEDVSILDLHDLIRLGREAYRERQDLYAERDELLYGAKREA